MKKALFAALCCLLAVSACKKDEQEVHVTGVSVSPATLSLVEGTSDQLRATVTPSDAANKSVSWTSSATAIATVDNTGKVTAVSAGTATITVKTADGGKTATCAVTVTTKVIPVTGISIEEGATAEVEEGKICKNALNIKGSGLLDTEFYKIYYHDTGLLIASLDEEAQEDLRANKNFGTYKGAIYENIVGEMLRKSGYEQLYFYKHDNPSLEMDFFVRDADSLVPVEVKSKDGATASLNNLIKWDSYPDVKYGIKLGYKNIGWNGQFYTFPYFLAFLLKRFLKEQRS